jgi:hypothetical protein
MTGADGEARMTSYEPVNWRPITGAGGDAR